MPAQKSHDLVVKTGEYQDAHGTIKGRYQNVGSLMVGEDGRPFIILERWFNPAGLPNPQNRSSVILSLFEPNQQQAPAQPPQGYQQPPPQQGYPQQQQPPAYGQHRR